MSPRGRTGADPAPHQPGGGATPAGGPAPPAPEAVDPSGPDGSSLPAVGPRVPRQTTGPGPEGAHGDRPLRRRDLHRQARVELGDPGRLAAVHGYQLLGGGYGLFVGCAAGDSGAGVVLSVNSSQ